MANIYIDGINGNDTTGDGSKLNPIKTVTKAQASYNGTSNSPNIWILLEDSEVDFESVRLIDSGRLYAHITTEDYSLKEIAVNNTGVSNVSVIAYYGVSNIKWVWNESDTQTNGLYFKLGVINCEFYINTIGSSNTYCQPGANFSDCYFKTGTNGYVRVIDPVLTDCIFDQCSISFPTFIKNYNFARCIFNNCRNSSYLNVLINITGESNIVIDQCSIISPFGTNFIDIDNVPDTTLIIIKNSIFEGGNYVIGLDADQNEFVSMKNCILYDCLASNPLYNISVLNITTVLSTNFLSTDYLDADFFVLTNTSSARGYSGNPNMDAGAFQAAPLYLLPAVGDVQEGVVFGNGASGDRIGTLELPAEDDVLDGIGYGADGTEFEGTLINDVPAEDDVRDGVSYDGGAKTGNIVLPQPEEVESGVVFDSNGSVVGTAILLPNQPGKCPLTLYTSDGSDIAVGYGPSQTFYLTDSTSVDAFLTALGISERIANGDAIVEVDDGNELLKKLKLVR